VDGQRRCQRVQQFRLAMGRVLQAPSRPGHVAALNSGVDLILVAYDSDQCYEVMYALLAAAREGRLDQTATQRSRLRLAKAAGR
jgi:beta-N-acetylhexosaminidase